MTFALKLTKLGNTSSPLDGALMADYYSLSLPVQTLTIWRPPNPLLVLPSSPVRLRRHVERFALHFKRERHFSFAQFSAEETSNKPDFVPWEAYLFHESADDDLRDDNQRTTRRRFFGACCFRLREGADAQKWSLDWVWLHPYFRESGHLTAAWSDFCRRYGMFSIEEPTSCGMRIFLEKLSETDIQAPVS